MTTVNGLPYEEFHRNVVFTARWALLTAVVAAITVKLASRRPEFQWIGWLAVLFAPWLILRLLDPSGVGSIVEIGYVLNYVSRPCISNGAVYC